MLKVSKLCEDENGEETPPYETPVPDMEDMGGQTLRPTGVAVLNKRKRDQLGIDSQRDSQISDASQNWRDVLGPPPPIGTTKVCLKYFKKYI